MLIKRQVWENATPRSFAEITNSMTTNEHESKYKLNRGRPVNNKAQLTLTNLRDAKACRKLLQFDVKTSCRQVNDLFEVMQQPSAPSGEWYWRILLENSVFSTPRTCLMPYSGWMSYTSLKSAFNGLQSVADNTGLF